MSDKAARKAFENWFSEEGKWPTAVEQTPDGNYKLCSAHSAWVAWQASWSSCQEFLDTSVQPASKGWSVNGGGSVVAEVDGFLFIQTSGPVDSAQKRAHLIAAAPDMYEALSLAVEKLKEYAEADEEANGYGDGCFQRPDEFIEATVAKCSAALAKVEGKS